MLIAMYVAESVEVASQGAPLAILGDHAYGSRLVRYPERAHPTRCDQSNRIGGPNIKVRTDRNETWLYFAR